VYVKWLEAAGARVVPIRYDLSTEELVALAKSVNGVLFTGGGPSLLPGSAYLAAAKTLFDTVVAQNKAGIHIPLWGTCAGFQTTSVIVAGTDSVLVPGFDSEDYSIPLDFTPAAPNSVLFGPAHDSPALGVYATLATKNVTANLHHSGIAPESFASNPNLASFFNVLSTNQGRQGKTFVSTAEGKDHPVFITQWHPERPQFEFNHGSVDLGLDHSPAGLFAMQYMANAFVLETRMNNNSFPTVEEEIDALIYNYAPSVTGSSYECYFFD